MTTTINASTSSGLVNTADTSGIIKLQSNGVTTNALAWVNFNGTGTVAIRSSYNVSSITDNGTGNYTVNFSTALSDANYSFSLTAGTISGNYLAATPYTNNPTTTQLQFNTVNFSSSTVDALYVTVSVFGN
jgi:hypothetical protein